MAHDQEHAINDAANHTGGSNGTLVGTEGGVVAEKPFTTAATASAIVQRGGSGQITLPSSDPIAGSDATSKDYVESLVRGHRAPVQVLRMVDDTLVTAPALGALDAGKAYVVAGTGGGWAGFSIGDIVEWDGAAWNLVLANSGAEPPDGTRVVVDPSPAAGSSFAGQGDDIGTYSTSGSSWSFTSANDGDIVAVIGENSIYENDQYIWDASSMTWNLMGGSANHNSLSGLQGGTSGEYYHFTSAEHAELQRYNADVVQAAASPSIPGTWGVGDRGIIITTTGTRKVWWCYVDTGPSLEAVRLN